MNFGPILFLALASLLLAHSGWAGSEPILIHARDGARLSGQIDFPSSSEVRGVVLLVPGTGLFDRDVEFGLTDSNNALIFREVSQFLTEKGMATVRYDQRGVHCNRRTMPPCRACQNRQDAEAHFIKSCIDIDIRSKVTPENIRDDIEEIYNHISSHRRLASKKVLVFGHSEGSIHLSYLIDQRRILPHGAIFMAGLAESPKDLIHWQMTERHLSALFEYDFDADGIVNNDEIRLGHKGKMNYLHGFPIEDLLSPLGHWTWDELRDRLEESYQKLRSLALGHSDDEPFGANGLVQASLRWWKMFFTDDRAVIENLVDYHGQVVYLNGTEDLQTNYSRQHREIMRLADRFSRRPKIIPIEGAGHTLGADPIYGPILPSSLEMIGEVCRDLVIE